MDTIEEVKNYVSTLHQKVRDNVDIIAADEIPGGNLYHIGTDGKVSSFIPRIPRRAAEAEDVTVPRVCVANTVLGCFIGHNACIHDFFDEQANKGGWYIYKFDFEFALYPNNKMAGDSSRSGEHWLVPYKQERWEYKAKVIGKIFFNSVRYYRVPDSKVAKGVVEAYIQVNPEETVGWSKAILLTEGYHHISMDIPTSSCQAAWRKHKHYEVNSISKSEFMEKKKVAASLLSYEEKVDNDLLPKVGDYIEVEEDVGNVTNAPWTSKVTAVEENGYRVEYNQGEEVYEIPDECFYMSKTNDDGKRFCYARQPIISKESFPASSSW